MKPNKKVNNTSRFNEGQRVKWKDDTPFWKSSVIYDDSNRLKFHNFTNAASKSISKVHFNEKLKSADSNSL